MSKRDDKELEEIYKSIDETADKLKAVFLTEKNEQIKSCTKVIYACLCNNASLTINDLNADLDCKIFLKNNKHLTEKDINTILNRLVEKKHIIKNTVKKPYLNTYKFNLNI